MDHDVVLLQVPQVLHLRIESRHGRRALQNPPQVLARRRDQRPLEQVIFVILQAHLGVDQAGMKIPAGEYEFQAKPTTQV